MEKVIILRYAEIHLKGNNRGFFENALLKNARNALKDFSCDIIRTGSRYIVKNYNEELETSIVKVLQKVFGFVSLSIGYEVLSNQEEIFQVINHFDFSGIKFRVSVKRADKKFPINSTNFASIVGSKVLEIYKTAKVSLKDYDKELSIDIRENGKTYIFLNMLQCASGMPTGTSGNALCLISGGIDSPVAIYKIAKRGATIYAIHFYSYPYTSLRAKQKVIDLLKILCEYVGSIKLIVIPFTKIQEEIHKNCDGNYMITIMRRMMFRIAEKVAHEFNCGAIVTGESLGQVASQTMESIISTNSVISMPVYRPLIGDDKDEIIEMALRIQTFDTSILPYEDCCTVFLPKNPIIKPNLIKVMEQENKLDIEKLVEDAITRKEIDIISNN